MGKRKILLAIIAGAVLVAAAAAVAVAAASRRTSGPDIAINGRDISAEEYLSCMESVEYDTKVQIQQEYGADYDEEFWTGEYGGRAGYEILAGNTVERLKYIHAVYDIAKENQDVDDAGYEAIKKRWEDENARRSEKSSNGEVIYGLQEYTFDLYLQYEMSSLKETYCNDDSREGMDLTEEEVLEHYNSRDWIYGENGEKANLDMARVAVEREVREQKYDDMAMSRVENSKVDGDMESASEFILKNIE